MSRAITVGVFCALGSALAYGGACSSTPPLDPALADVVFQAPADGPALDKLLAVTPVKNAANAPVIDSPPTDSELPGSTIVTFKWHASGATAAWHPGSRLLPDLAGPRPAPPRWRALTDLLGPERAAHAGQSGVGYYLTFATDTKPNLLRVFTTETSYTPDAAAWKKLGAVMTWTELTVFAATFDDDALVPGSGPLESDPILFCIGWDATPDGG